MTTPEPGKQSLSLLYVEDEADSQETIGAIIRHRYPDICLHMSVNGKKGLELFKRFPDSF